MFEVSGLSDVGNIGARNAEAAKAILKELGNPAGSGRYRTQLW